MTGNHPRAARSPRRAQGSPPRQATPPPPPTLPPFFYSVFSLLRPGRVPFPMSLPQYRVSSRVPPCVCLGPDLLPRVTRHAYFFSCVRIGFCCPRVPLSWGGSRPAAQNSPRPVGAPPPIVMTAMRTARPHRPRAATNCPDGPAPPLHCPAPPGRFPGSPVDCVCAPAPCAGGHPMTLTPPPFLIATLWPMDPLHVRPSHVAPFDPIILSSGWSLGLRHRWIPAVHPSFSPQPRRLALPDHPRLPSCSAPAAPDPRPSLGTTPRSVYIRIPSVPCCPSDPGGD